MYGTLESIQLMIMRRIGRLRRKAHLLYWEAEHEIKCVRDKKLLEMKLANARIKDLRSIARLIEIKLKKFRGMDCLEG